MQRRIRNTNLFCQMAAALSLMLLLGASARADIEALREREEKIVAAAERVLPCTVCIRSGSGFGVASGSGVIVSESGLILTAGHVIGEPGSDLTIIFPDGTEVPAKAVGSNRSQDGGMAQITEEGPWPYVNLGEDPTEGDWVFSMGHAGGFDPGRTPPLRIGRIVSTVLPMFGLISDCTLIGGDSGGPLYNLEGEVVGIHSSIGLTLSENRHVPISTFKEDWDRMVAGETWGSLGQLGGLDPDSAYLGVGFEPSEEGITLSMVVPGSPAESAGLLVGDVILSIGEMEIENPLHIVQAVTASEPGASVPFEILREGEQMTINVELGLRSDYE